MTALRRLSSVIHSRFCHSSLTADQVRATFFVHQVSRAVGSSTVLLGSGTVLVGSETVIVGNGTCAMLVDGYFLVPVPVCLDQAGLSPKRFLFLFLLLLEVNVGVCVEEVTDSRILSSSHNSKGVLITSGAAVLVFPCRILQK